MKLILRFIKPLLIKLGIIKPKIDIKDGMTYQKDNLMMLRNLERFISASDTKFKDYEENKDYINGRK